jgi:integral membrane sensor domain MASE1
MTKFSAYLKISFAILLYIISAFTFVDYIFSLLILDTVTAIENAFGKLVILIFMLVLAKLILAAGKAQLKKKQGDGTEQFRPSETNDPFQLNRSESEIHEQGKEAESKRKPF